MHRDRVVALYDVHSWAGIVFGVLIFLVCVSGAIAVFTEEIDRWSNPALQLGPHAPITLDADTALRRLTEAHPLAAEEGHVLRLPSYELGVYSLNTPTTQEPVLHRTYLHPTTGELLPERQSYLFFFLRHLHIRLLSHWNGRLFVGIVGMAMLLSIVTGLLIHKHIFRDFFRMRWKPGKDARALLSDLHKWLGVWGVAFHVMIALTGTWLALAQYVSAPMALAKFDGNAAAARAGLVQPRAKPAAEMAAMLPIAPFITDAATRITSFTPTYVVLENWGRSNAQLAIHGDVPGYLLQRGASFVRYSAVDGAMLGSRDYRELGFWGQFRGAIEPLHYGYYGGVWLKLIYLALGLMPALMAISGALIWFDRRQRLAGKQERIHRASSGEPLVRRLVVALFGAAWIALLFSLVVPVVATLAGRHIGSVPMTPLFLLSWGGLTVFLSWWRTQRAIALWTARFGVGICAVGAVAGLIPPLDTTSLAITVASALLAWLHHGGMRLLSQTEAVTAVAIVR
jgi:uncharacterized iron-regulated membrane protein